MLDFVRAHPSDRIVELRALLTGAVPVTGFFPDAMDALAVLAVAGVFELAVGRATVERVEEARDVRGAVRAAGASFPGRAVVAARLVAVAAGATLAAVGFLSATAAFPGDDRVVEEVNSPALRGTTPAGFLFSSPDVMEARSGS